VVHHYEAHVQNDPTKVLGCTNAILERSRLRCRANVRSVATKDAEYHNHEAGSDMRLRLRHFLRKSQALARSGQAEISAFESWRGATGQGHCNALSPFLIQTPLMSHRKRKYRQRSDTCNSQYDQPDGPLSPHADPTLFIVAHEADIIRGPQAARTADSLEVGINIDGKGGSRIGDGLLKWEWSNGAGGSSERGDVWVDRYVVLHVIDSNPAVPSIGL
jgi:hypothetical protein